MIEWSSSDPVPVTDDALRLIGSILARGWLRRLQREPEHEAKHEAA